MSKKPKDDWHEVRDADVRHIWSNPDGTGEIPISPTFYADSGTPVCDEDAGDDAGRDMVYVRTEIRHPAVNKPELVLGRIYGLLYFDSSKNVFDPEKQCGNADDLLVEIADELRAVYAAPHAG
jgi:hypothetical protein